MTQLYDFDVLVGLTRSKANSLFKHIIDVHRHRMECVTEGDDVVVRQLGDYPEGQKYKVRLRITGANQGQWPARFKDAFERVYSERKAKWQRQKEAWSYPKCQTCRNTAGLNQTHCSGCRHRMEQTKAEEILADEKLAQIMDRPICDVKIMKTSAGLEYYVCLNKGDRYQSLYTFKEWYKAAYTRDELNAFLEGGPKPYILDYDETMEPPV